MSTQSEPRIIPTYKEIVIHLRTPLYRNGYFLVISSLSTSGIGLLYWILAAHRYPTYLVGINSAMIAAMTFVAGVSELNLMSALIRFIPMTGRSTKHFVLLSYLVSLFVAAILSYVFSENMKIWSPTLNFLGSERALTIWFIISTMGWCIFVLQDSVLTGLRQASWVPIENTVFSLTKIALMIIFAASIPAIGIFASWSFALIVAILPTNFYIFRRLIPNHQHKKEQADLSIEPKQVIRFAAADYIGALSWIMANTLMPIIVTTVSGATANAYFYLSWTIANTLYLIATALGSSLVVETAKDQHKLAYYSRRVYKNMMSLVAPASIFICIGAHYILMIFGKGYSSEGAALLRLLALSAIPNVFNTIYISTARVQRHMRQVAMTLGSLCLLILGSSFLFLKLFGIAGVGIGWVASQTVVAVLVYIFPLRNLWKNIHQVSNDAMETNSKGFSSPVHLLAYKLAKTLNIVPIAADARQKLRTHSKAQQISAMLPEISNQLSRWAGETSDGNWKLDHVAYNHTNTTVFFLKSTNGSAPLVIKIPDSGRDAESLRKQSSNLITLAGCEDLGEFRSILPVVIMSGKVKDTEFFAETAVRGIPLSHFVNHRTIEWHRVELAANEISKLHRRTAKYTKIDEQLLQSWVDGPLDILYHYAFSGATPHGYRQSTLQLRNKLHAGLSQREAVVSWIHGDYSPLNILLNTEGTKITGIVDWDLAKPNELPLLDLLHLLISIRMITTQREMGAIVSELLLGQRWSTPELVLIQSMGQGLLGNSIELQDLLLLTWLRHIHANITKTSRFEHHRQWAVENYYTVLDALVRIGL